MVFSRPSRSDAHPHDTRAAPLAIGLSVVASVSAAIDIHRKLTLVVFRPHALTMGPALAVISKPPVAINTNMM